MSGLTNKNDSLERILEALSLEEDVNKVLGKLDAESKARFAELLALETKIANLEPTDFTSFSINIDQLLEKSESSIDLNLEEDLLPGVSFGAYQIVREIGRGGMGRVYEAVQTHLGKRVALKVISPSVIRDPHAIARFRTEMKAAGQVDHSNIASAMDAGEINGTLYLVTEFVSGMDLNKYVVEHGPMTINKALDIILQAAHALRAAHVIGVTHRDVKPSNLILTDKGQIKLLDLGLAHINDEHKSDFAVSGAIFGTPDYMSPEQWTSADCVDRRSDMYSLGCTLYYLLTGHAPFGGENYPHAYSKMKAHIEEALPKLKEVPPAISVPIDNLLAKMTAKNPNDRFADVGDLIAYLESLEAVHPEIYSPSNSTPPSAFKSQTDEPPEEIAKENCSVDRERTNATTTPANRLVRRWMLSGLIVIPCVTMVWFAFHSTFPQSPIHTASISDAGGATVSPNIALPRPDLQRRAIEWILSVGGSAEVDSGQKPIRALQEIPSEAFKISAVRLYGCKGFSHKDFEVVAQLSTVSGIHAYDSAINDECLKSIARHRNEDTEIVLEFTNCEVSNTGIQALSKLKYVRWLGLTGTKFNNLQLLEDFPWLQRLDIGKCSVDAEHLDVFEKLPELDFLGIDAYLYQKLSDVVPSLQERLVGLWLYNVEKQLPTATFSDTSSLRELRIYYSPNSFDPQAIRQVAALPNLESLFLDCPVPERCNLDIELTEGAFESLKELTFFHVNPSPSFIKSMVSRARNLNRVVLYCGDFDDAAAREFSAATQLRELQIVHSKVTQPFIEKLASEHPEWRVQWNNQVVRRHLDE